MIKNNIIKWLLVCFIISLWIVNCSKDTTGPDNEQKQIGWIVGSPLDGYGSIFYTNDGGQNWVRQGDSLSIPNVSLGAVKAVDSLHAWILGDQADEYATILKTSDGGSTWERIENRGGIPNEELLGLHVYSLDELWVVGSNNTIIYTNDGGNTWTSKADTSFLPYNLCSIAVVNDKIWVCGNEMELGGTIIHSSDYGDTWFHQAEGEFLSERGMIEISAASDSCLWVVGHGRTILHTSNGGDTWEIQKTDIYPTWDANGVCAISEDVAWVVEDVGWILYTENGGENWELQETPGSAGGILLYRISPLNKDEAWVVGPYGGKIDLGMILHTVDGGQTWTIQDYGYNTLLMDVSFVGAYH
ncbi:MAG: hypothetical protein KAW92_10000 [Candidatus Cloacimonetes bacterium]|nr:hypothetical protein [Candidatus Cloacimonadota bacterium]